MGLQRVRCNRANTHTHAHTHTHKAAKYQISQVKEFSAFLCMGKIKGFCWRRKWQPTPVFLPGESHGQRSLVGYSPWSHKEVDTTDQITHTHTHTRVSVHLTHSWDMHLCRIFSICHLSGASKLCFPIPSFLRAHHGEWLQSDGC